jgi:hypothetical protein
MFRSVSFFRMDLVRLRSHLSSEIRSAILGKGSYSLSAPLQGCYCASSFHLLFIVFLLTAWPPDR